MDVKVAFLNGEDIYIEQPEGLVILSKKYKVYKMVKFLYGLC